ncbi:MAG: FKBP-type peptidyl-prolyl cis-trans isomerase, partial [Spirochaetales bacterium]|nr:FKBP-type peptidyl-prolyl cis-trans isomerase [Spirochaetales bacterium]
LTIGSGTFIPGFEEGLIGAEIGKQINLNLTFPEDYKSAELAETFSSLSSFTFSAVIVNFALFKLPFLIVNFLFITAV